MSKNLIPAAVPAVVGCGFAAYAYFAHGTGITGSAGALLALIGGLAAVIGILVAGLTARQGAAFNILACLVALGAALTAVAGFFLMQYGVAAAMALTLVGIVYVLSRPAAERRPA